MDAPSEFEIIQRDFIAAGFPQSAALRLGPGDDCAILTPEPGVELCLSIDTLVSGVHFPATAHPDTTGYRALATSLSDLAAMGAEPLLFTIALTIPEYRREWVEGFATGLRRGAERFEVALAGGDLTRGPLSVTIQVMGSVPAGSAIRRSGASPGEDLYVTGSIGDAGWGVRIAGGDESGEGEAAAYLLSRFEEPEPRIAVGAALREVASAAIDVSDGLLQDLGHIADQSGVGADVRLDRLPLSRALTQTLGRRDAERLALVSGDDYELCFTARESERERISAIAAATGVAIARIGRIVGDRRVRCLDGDGREVMPGMRGYLHF